MGILGFGPNYTQHEKRALTTLKDTKEGTIWEVQE